MNGRKSSKSIFWLISLLFLFIMCCDAYLISSPEELTKDFQRYELISPVIHSSNRNRLRRSTHSGKYPHHITLKYSTQDHSTFILDLSLNLNLLSNKYYEASQESKNSFDKDTNLYDHCYYQGKIRNIENSWAAISTCNNHISGVVGAEDEIYYIEPKVVNATHSSHYLVKQSHMLDSNQFKCGYSGKNSSNFHTSTLRKRWKRDVKTPHSSNRYSRYVELILVNDHIEFEKFGKNKTVLFERSKQIGNIVNALYAPLNIYIALVGVDIWADHDEVELSRDGDATLTEFLKYRHERLVHKQTNDNAQLITGLVFKDGVVGKALKGTICTHKFSGGVNMDHSKIVGLVATTVAHELGHNFGMEHDDDARCECPANKCIMAPSSSSTRPSHWSSCSLEYLHLAYEQGMDHCLRNKPQSLIGPVCGNGFVEEGEQCDCGLKEYCNNYCCNPNTCMLHANASCATGQCCDLSTCQVKPVAYNCREAISECDLPEYCDGETEFCPSDVFIEDGTSCKDEQAHCVKGQCKTLLDQCKLLWGPSGKVADDRCFKQNRKGSENGNCGYNLIYDNYTACDEKDVMCGMLHCLHLNEKLEFGMQSASKIAKTRITISKDTFICRHAVIDLGVDVIDPGLTPDGAICGNDKMCYNKKCVDVTSVKRGCPFDCYNNGVCNSNGNCHCVRGFAPPLCDGAGPGGSVDSGPASDPAAMYRFVVVMLVLFLGVVPLLVIIACIAYYFRRNLKGLWMGKARRAAIKTRPVQPVKPRPGPISKFNGIDKANLRKLDISSPMPINGTVFTSVPIPPAQSILDSSNTLRGIQISNPVLNSQTNNPSKTIPVRPAPPKPNAVHKPSNHPSSLNRKESSTGKRPRPISGYASRPSAPPPCPPPPTFWGINKNKQVGKQEAPRPPPLPPLNKQKGSNRTNVSALAQQFEKKDTAVASKQQNSAAKHNSVQA